MAIDDANRVSQRGMSSRVRAQSAFPARLGSFRSSLDPESALRPCLLTKRPGFLDRRHSEPKSFTVGATEIHASEQAEKGRERASKRPVYPFRARVHRGLRFRLGESWSSFAPNSPRQWSGMDALDGLFTGQSSCVGGFVQPKKDIPEQLRFALQWCPEGGD
jgi:hypothetical protein